MFEGLDPTSIGRGLEGLDPTSIGRGLEGLDPDVVVGRDAGSGRCCWKGIGSYVNSNGIGRV